jgi:hypothetical protein
MDDKADRELERCLAPHSQSPTQQQDGPLRNRHEPMLAGQAHAASAAELLHFISFASSRH